MGEPASASMSASVEVGAVVDRGRPQLDREAHPLPRPELVAVQAQPEPGGPARLQHRPALVGVEGPDLAEGVDPAGVRRAGREHLAADQGHVGVRVGLELGRDDVGAEEGDVVGDPRGHLAGLRFVGDVEAVARLDLDVGDPGADPLGAPRPREPLELGRVGPPRRLRGDPDAARLVCLARHPGGELRRAVAGEDEVGVAVDEAWHHAAPAGVDPGVGLHPGPLDRDHPVVLEDERGVAELAQLALAEGRIAGDEQADVVDRERAHRAAPLARERTGRTCRSGALTPRRPGPRSSAAAPPRRPPSRAGRPSRRTRRRRSGWRRRRRSRRRRSRRRRCPG